MGWPFSLIVFRFYDFLQSLQQVKQFQFSMAVSVCCLTCLRGFLFEPGNSSFTTTRDVAVAVLSKVRKPVSSTAFHSFRQAAHCVQPMATRPWAALSSIFVCQGAGGGFEKKKKKKKKKKKNKGL